ncbi:MAG: hypothetical protein KGL39_58995, partial [Patescibacteria group bacterium]|nr:hypothetical protein [Patescibacteria group bacterium]
NWLPFSVGLGQVSRMVDPDQRVIRSHGMENGFGLLDAIRDRIPFASEGLLPRRDVFGMPIQNGGQKNYQNDRTIQQLDALKIYPAPLQRKIRGVQLTDAQYDDYTKVAGIAVKMRLDQIVRQPGFTQMPPHAQIETINETIKAYREQARTAILMKYPEILQQAQIQKRRDLFGEAP